MHGLFLVFYSTHPKHLPMRVGFKLLHISVQFSENLNTEVFVPSASAGGLRRWGSAIYGFLRLGQGICFQLIFCTFTRPHRAKVPKPTTFIVLF